MVQFNQLISNPETKMTDFYPEIEPYNAGILDVGNGHRIYFEECGNPKGIPLLFVHGGPGGSFEPTDRRFYDPNKWRIVLFDQRGCGKSQALDEIVANTTPDLVNDMRRLLDLLGIKQAVLFGGSWGSTLALAFAITYPERVLGIILRGIFLGTKKEIDYFYKDGFDGVGMYFPENWGRYISHVPSVFNSNPLQYYYEKILSEDKTISELFAYELARYEYSMSHLVQMPEAEIEKEIHSFPYGAMSMIECHYFLNQCFMSKGFILDNAKGLANIPTSIVQGRYDMVCTPISAQLLHLALPNSTLHWTTAGHARTDPGTQEKLIEETNLMYDKVKNGFIAAF